MSKHTEVKIQHGRDGVWLHMSHASQHFSLNLSAHDTSRKLAMALALCYPQDSKLHQLPEVERLKHNVRVLTDAVWKACGDDEATVNGMIESQGELQ